MADESATSIFRSATALEAMRRARAVAPDTAPDVAEAGRARFYDALAGRYGLPGAALEPASLTADPRDLDVAGVRALADGLSADGRLDREGAGLLGLDLAGLGFAGDPVFGASPLSLFANAWGQEERSGPWDWIAQHTRQHRYLVAEGGDPRAVRASERVLEALHALAADRAFYATMDRARDAREGRSAGPLANPFASLTLPPQALALLADPRAADPTRGA